MPAKTRVKRIPGGLGAVLLVLILGYLVICPWYLGWGATKEERSCPMAGDLALLSGLVWLLRK